MTRSLAALLLGPLLLASAPAVADDTFACKDAEGTWVLGNVEQHRCASRIQKFKASPPSARVRRETPATWAYDEVRAMLAAPPAYREHIRNAAMKYRLSEELLHAVMFVESGFRHDAVSGKGAMGLMQLMPGTAKDMYVRDVWSPADNIDGGARYLRTLANQYDGDIVRTLAAYNAGPEAVRRAGGVPSYRETQEYVRRVLELCEKLRIRNASGGKSADRRDG